MSIDPRSFKGLSRFLAPSAGGPLADRALGEKLITSAQLEECVEIQDRTGRPLDEILVEKGYLKADAAVRLRQPALPPEVIAASEDPEKLLGHYVLVSLLGTGGMAEVWKAWDRSLGRWVAVKYLKADIGHPTQRIEREGRMAGGLSHPGIVSIFERGQHEGRAYLVMHYIEGAPAKSPLPPFEAARVVLEVSQALAYAHQNGVIHRDVKPANILIDRTGRVLLADFGLAIADNAMSSRWAVSGTPEYASPEQIRGDVLDLRTDIYSLGATFYQLLAGRPPFTGRDVDEITQRVLLDPLPPLRGAPQPLVKVVKKAMARERDQRYAAMGELTAELQRFMDTRTKRRGLRRTAVALFLLAAVVPWVFTLVILRESQHHSQKLEILSYLAEGQRELARAEQLRSDGEATARDVTAAVLRAVSPFRHVIRAAREPEPDAFLGLGRCYELIGLESDAEGAYRNAASRRDARLGLVRIWLRRAFERPMEPQWKRSALELLNKEPAESSGGVIAVLKSSCEGRWEEVLAGASAALERDRYDDVLQMCAAIAALELGRWDQALSHFDQAARLRRSDATSLYWKARAQAGKGMKPEARETLKRAIASALKTWMLLADAEKRLKDLGE